jgi:nucleoside phosphorylase
LKAQGLIRIEGPRAATRWIRGTQPAAERLQGHSWTFAVSRTALGDRATEGEAVVRRLFRDVAVRGDSLFACAPWRACADETLVALLEQALSQPEAPSLERLWKLARALEVNHAFVDQLPSVARKTLAEALRSELVEALEYLGVLSDARLEFFAEGHDDVSPELAIREMSLPRSRLASLIATKHFLDHHHREIADHYFDDLAAAFASVADAFPLADFLRQLPPGRAHLAAVEQVWRRRPELIATYVWHPTYHAEGAYLLLQLPQAMPLGNGQTVKLAEEWAEVQRLGREQLVFAERSEDRASVVALGVHDEARAIARRHFDVSPSLLQQATYEDCGVWAKAVKSRDRADLYVGALDEFFHARVRHSDASFVFALKLLGPLREQHQEELALRLAGSVVDGYAASLALDITTMDVPDVLPAYGSLLEQLRVALGETQEGNAQWARWLRPFDVAAHLDLARQSNQPGYDSREVNPRFDVPKVMRSHAEVLVAQALSSSAPGAALEAAVDLCVADKKTGLAVDAFAWHALAQTTEYRQRVAPPLFVGVGRLVARDQDNSEPVRRLLAETPPAHVLAYLALGLGPTSPLVPEVRRLLRDSLNVLLHDEGGVALGHALELASTLHQAGMGRDAERFARRVVLVAERLQPHARQPYADAGNAILAGALAQQELWPELLALDADVQGRPQALFVKNMRVLALIETKDLDGAGLLLDEILQEDPTNRVALVNRTAYFVRTGAWEKALSAAETARTILSTDELDGVAVNEALARDKLGDRFSALRVLESMPPSGADRNEVQALIAELRSGRLPPEQAVRADAMLADNGTSRPPANDIQVRVPVTDGAADPVDIAIITALPEEYEAVRGKLRDPTPAPPETTRQFPNLYSWVLGTIPKASGDGYHRVVLAVAGQSGNLRSLPTTMRTIDQWKPTIVVFSGIAGGIAKNNLKQGDIVLSREIWHYEYGKVIEGSYAPRQRDSFHTHSGLLNSALSFSRAAESWRDCGQDAPTQPHCAACISGLIGSGEKVLDDLEPAFVQAVLRARPEIQAVEMEAAGAAFAVERAHEEGKVVQFIMVRGISDLPEAPAPAGLKKAWRWLMGAPRRAKGAGTAERDAWKLFASAIAANFTTCWIASPEWPSEPRRIGSPPGVQP